VRFIPFSAALLAALFLVPAAGAETLAPDVGCKTAYPTIGATVPASIPGIPFLGPYAPTVTAASLTAPDGTVVPTKVVYESAFPSAAVVLAILEPLAADTTYTLRWADDCGVFKTQTFKTTAAVTLPTTAGTITVSEQHKAPTCYGPKWPAQRDVLFAEDPTLLPFLPVAKVDLLVDGKIDSYSSKAFGQYKDDSSAGRVFQSCPAAPRTLRLALQVKIANGPTLVTPEITTELRCPEPTPEDCPDTGPLDTGTYDTSVYEDDSEIDSSIDLPDPDAGSDPDDAQIPTPPDSATAATTGNDVVVGGCTCNTPRPAATAHWLLGLIALPLAARRTKRGRRSPSSGD
jgi:hypothetical protein